MGALAGFCFRAHVGYQQSTALRCRPFNSGLSAGCRPTTRLVMKTGTSGCLFHWILTYGRGFLRPRTDSRNTTPTPVSALSVGFHTRLTVERGIVLGGGQQSGLPNHATQAPAVASSVVAWCKVALSGIVRTCEESSKREVSTAGCGRRACRRMHSAMPCRR
jgi:hypothetical protein